MIPDPLVEESAARDTDAGAPNGLCGQSTVHGSASLRLRETGLPGDVLPPDVQPPAPEMGTNGNLSPTGTGRPKAERNDDGYN